MSKLLRLLENLAKDTGEPIGFKAVAHRSKGVPILFILALPRVDAQLAKRLGDAADALLMPINDPEKDITSLKNLGQVTKELLWGVWLKSAVPAGSLPELGADFVVFEPERMAASLLRAEELGKVAEIAPSLAEGLVSAMEELPIDAVMLSGSSDFISVQQLMTYRWISDLVSKPLLVVLSGELSTEDIGSLWGAGVQGVVIPVKTAADKDRLVELRHALENMPLKRTGGKYAPLLPRLGPQTSSADEDDED